MASSTIVVVAALRQEIAPLRRELRSIRFVKTGIGPERARTATHQGCDGAALIISTGCCGGLVAAASVGMLGIPDQVLQLSDSAVATAPAPDLRLQAKARLVAEGLGLHVGLGQLATVCAPLCTPQDKQDAHLRSGAVAVDMETAAIAEAARQMGIPYVSIRVVLDTVSERLPDPNHRSADPEGGRWPGRLLKAAVSHPVAVMDLARLAMRLRTVSAPLARTIAAFVNDLDEPAGSG